MRNVFDQYSEPENKLTHALACALDQDRALLREFLRWVGWTPVGGKLVVLEQRVPGQALVDLEEGERRGLPDMWVHDEGAWSLLVESKVSSPLEADQLRRHISTARRNGFEDLRLLALTLEGQQPVKMEGVIHRTWPELYVWAQQQSSSSAWAATLAEYMEIAEARMSSDGYLKEGKLTRFHGIPFNAENPYTYREAKRVLGLLTDELREHEGLRRLGMDPTGKGRSAITGRNLLAVWDYIPLRVARGAGLHTSYPHLTLGIHQDRLEVMVTVPNGIQTKLRRNLLGDGVEDLRQLLVATSDEIERAVATIERASPRALLQQRHYLSQRSAGTIDSRLDFDLRTASDEPRGKVKIQHQWIEAVHGALSERRSNLQLGIGANLPYGDPGLNTPAVVELVAGVWMACGSFLSRLLGRE